MPAPMNRATTLEAVLKRDRAVVAAGLAGIVVLAWAYLGYLAREMAQPGMAAEMAMPRMQAWGVLDLVLLFVMWAVMMVGMMVPSATPMILTFVAVNRRRRPEPGPFVSTGVFLAGYLLTWTGFSLLATLAQWGLHTAALLSPMMVTTSPVLGGVLLIGAGIFQWTPLKDACLTHCRSPLSFIMTSWRDGPRGAVLMGLRHGGYCLGCCWLLMVLLFVAGVMNLLWVAAIAAFVLLEKVVPRGALVSQVGGGALVVAGVVLLARGWPTG